MKRVDYAGKRFGRLTVLELAGIHNGISMWLCRCDCGRTAIKRRNNLQSGNTKSCGCRERMRHGHARTGKVSSEYRIWLQMRDRCRNQNNRAYRWYGALGINVCERWDKFQNFIDDMGPKPTDGWWSIDRIDPAKDYCPENCRWATREQQRANQRPKGSVTGGMT